MYLGSEFGGNNFQFDGVLVQLVLVQLVLDSLPVLTVDVIVVVHGCKPTAVKIVQNLFGNSLLFSIGLQDEKAKHKECT